ncbi:MAG: hypothetical protein JW768_04645 [Chitinispirillaceae bacterium]|nr:hypothetical protein [Chitinispirillaceae bacterium]
MVFPVLLFAGCSKPAVKPPLLVLRAHIEEEGKNLFLVLHNESTRDITICTRNFYDKIECLDIRAFPDTAEIPDERLFGKGVQRTTQDIITLDDFIRLDIGQETRIPVDLSGIYRGCKLGDSVFISVFFKNIDPVLCSKVEVENHDKATQDYCKLLHVIPTRANTYWSGEVRTPYYRINPCAFAPKKTYKKQRTSKVRVLRKSKTHPLKHKVF